MNEQDRSAAGSSRPHQSGPDLFRAAANAAEICLSATADDRAVVVCDNSTRMIAEALQKALTDAGAKVTSFNLDDAGERPLGTLPGKIAAALRGATVSALAAEAIRGELSVRRTILEIVSERKIRHAHMPSITPEVFVDGLAVDYRKVSEVMQRLAGILRENDAVTLSTPAGSRLEISYPKPPTIAILDGIISPNEWQNIPSGQIIVYPSRVNGVFVADRNLGDWFGEKYDVSAYPVRMVFEDGFARNIECDNKKLERDLRLFIGASENSNRVSELVVGANLGLTQNHSNPLFDGYRPGASLGLGSFKYNRKVSWSSATVLPIFCKRSSLFVGERQIMMDDAFAAELLPHM